MGSLYGCPLSFFHCKGEVIVKTQQEGFNEPMETLSDYLQKWDAKN